MIFIVTADTGEVRVFDGPNVDVAMVSLANFTSHQLKLMSYAEDNPAPSDEKARQAWVAGAPKRITMEEWFLKNNYKEVEFVSLNSSTNRLRLS